MNYETVFCQLIAWLVRLTRTAQNTRTRESTNWKLFVNQSENFLIMYNFPSYSRTYWTCKCMQPCTYTHALTYIHTYIHVRMKSYAFTCVYTHTHTHTHIYIYIYIYTHRYTRITSMHTNIHMNLSYYTLHKQTYSHTHMLINKKYTHVSMPHTHAHATIHIHTHTHTHTHT